MDTKRLRVSEKKLLKETVQLGRKCKLLTEEKDRAEDRLKIEQTQVYYTIILACVKLWVSYLGCA